MFSLRPPYTVFALLTLLNSVACAELTEPGSGSPAKPASTTAPTAGAPAEIAAAHILIAYQGAMRSRATRTKEEAKKLADEVLAKAKSGQDFAALSSQYSDDTGAKSQGGSLGRFGRQQMVEKFSTAAFALRPGGISAVVETDFGFHIIKRTE